MLNHHTHIDPQVLINSFNAFFSQARSILHIHNEDDYREAMSTLDALFDVATDTPDDPVNDVITLIGNAIEQYESTLPATLAFDEACATINSDVSMLRLLMDGHGLSGADFENEIGKKSYVSLILSGDRKMTKEHIEKLAARFGISPSLFFP